MIITLKGCLRKIFMQKKFYPKSEKKASKEKPYRFESIQKSLAKTEMAASNDCKAFNEWFRDKITLEECVEKFIKNNDIKFKDFSNQEFKEWLFTLGWQKVETEEA